MKAEKSSIFPGLLDGK